MKEKFLSFLKKRIEFLSFKEVKYVLKIFSLREKIIFAFFAIMFITSVFVIAWKTSNNVLIDVPAIGGTLTEGIVIFNPDISGGKLKLPVPENIDILVLKL